MPVIGLPSVRKKYRDQGMGAIGVSFSVSVSQSTVCYNDISASMKEGIIPSPLPAATLEIVDATVKQEQILDEQVYNSLMTNPSALNLDPALQSQLSAIINQYTPLITAKQNELDSYYAANKSVLDMPIVSSTYSYVVGEPRTDALYIHGVYNTLQTDLNNLIIEKDNKLHDIQNQIQNITKTYSDMAVWKTHLDNFHMLQLKNQDLWPWIPAGGRDPSAMITKWGGQSFYTSTIQNAENRRIAKVNEISNSANEYITILSGRVVAKAQAEAAKIKAQQALIAAAQEAQAIAAAKLQAEQIIAAAIAAQQAAIAAAKAAEEAAAAKKAAEEEAARQEAIRIAAEQEAARLEAARIAAEEEAEAERARQLLAAQVAAQKAAEEAEAQRIAAEQEAARQEAERMAQANEAARIAAEQEAQAIAQTKAHEEITAAQVANPLPPEQLAQNQATANEHIDAIMNTPITDLSSMVVTPVVNPTGAPTVAIPSITTKVPVAIDKKYMIHPLFKFIEGLRS
jgi:hypothetical protein